MIPAMPAHVLLLTGSPGAGKTTLVGKVAAALAELRPAGRGLCGFTTEEIRVGRERAGFRIVPLDGPGRVMAHVDLRGAPRVGRYGVDVAAIDAVAGATLALTPGADLYLVDEIGKMECLSARFIAAMRRLLDSDRRLVATVARSGGCFIDEVKTRPDVELWQVTRQNRDRLVRPILEWIKAV
jgi:nucleoside-triphosphatase